MKICPKCKEEKSIESFSRDMCKSCRNAYVRAWKIKNKDRLLSYQKRDWLKSNIKKFGLTLEDFEELLIKQNGLCAICGLPPTVKALAVDHDHETGKVRGLLCIHCNLALGHLKDSIDNLEKMIYYLKSNGNS